MISALVIWPFALAVAAFLAPAALARAAVLAGAIGQLALAAAAWALRPGPAWNGWIAADDLALPIVTVTAAVFLGAALRYAFSPKAGHEHDLPASAAAGCLLAMLGAMNLAILSRHFGLLWIAVEATTLAGAPLIYMHRNPRALEATWKYLLLCSVGVALALLGVYLLAAAASAPTAGGGEVELTVDALARDAASLKAPWLKAAFIFFLVGFGTKMGLAPMHTWLPDAHSEAPSAVSALLSGAMLNVAFVGLLRVHQVCVAAGLGAFSGGLLTAFGLLSVGVAALFLLGASDYKRMLAYSSIEHMGLLALGLGAGAPGLAAALFHAVNHSLTKCALFLTAGRILDATGTKRIAEARGLSGRMPATAAVWLVGLFAISGAPPFGVFFSEFKIFHAVFGAARWGVGLAALLLLAVAFAGLARAGLRMATRAESGAEAAPPARRLSPWGDLAPAIALLVVVAALGLRMPAFLDATLHIAAAGGLP